MEHKNKLKNIVILALILIIMGLCGCLFMGGTQKKDVVYKDYHDDLIKVENSIHAEVLANVIRHKEYLGVYINSKEMTSRNLKLTLHVVDNHEKMIYEETLQIVVPKEGKAALTFPLPQLENEEVKELLLKVDSKEEVTIAKDLEQFTFQIDEQVDELQNVDIRAEVLYQGEQNVSLVQGAIVILNHNKIVDLIDFIHGQVGPHEQFSAFTTLNSVLQ